MQWSREARLKYARKPARPLCIRADDAALDEQCRATLRKLVRAGCTRANHPYSLEQFQVAEQELRHLKQHGFVHAEASALLQPVLQSCERQKTGADVGKITVVLNVRLY
jgi:N-acetylglutamate synthase-like GNAT family acetyltransferase